MSLSIVLLFVTGVLVLLFGIVILLWRANSHPPPQATAPTSAPITVPGIQEMRNGDFSIRSGDVYLYTLGQVIVGRRDIKTPFSVRQTAGDVYSIAYKGYYLNVYPFVLKGKTIYSIRLMAEPCPWTITKTAKDEFTLSTTIDQVSVYLAVDDRDPLFFVTAVTNQDSTRVSNQFTFEE